MSSGKHQKTWGTKPSAVWGRPLKEVMKELCTCQQKGSRECPTHPQRGKKHEE